MPDQRLRSTIERYKTDSQSVYNTWFLGSQERQDAFRTMPGLIEQVVADIRALRFPNDFRGSSLELVLKSITAQKQVFEGAAHAFYWKPKLGIPDIYETPENKLAFGEFLHNCLCAEAADDVHREILVLGRLGIKGLGPAVANILYFLHPAWFPPFNTAIVNGFNTLAGEKKKLGSWADYLGMRSTLMALNGDFHDLLSSDLGAIAGLCFELGTGKLALQSAARA